MTSTRGGWGRELPSIYQTHSIFFKDEFLRIKSASYTLTNTVTLKNDGFNKSNKMVSHIKKQFAKFQLNIFLRKQFSKKKKK
jgi:hypothetical protein